MTCAATRSWIPKRNQNNTFVRGHARVRKGSARLTVSDIISHVLMRLLIYPSASAHLWPWCTPQVFARAHELPRTPVGHAVVVGASSLVRAHPDVEAHRGHLLHLRRLGAGRQQSHPFANVTSLLLLRLLLPLHRRSPVGTRRKPPASCVVRLMSAHIRHTGPASSPNTWLWRTPGSRRGLFPPPPRGQARPIGALRL